MNRVLYQLSYTAIAIVPTCMRYYTELPPFCQLFFASF